MKADRVGRDAERITKAAVRASATKIIRRGSILCVIRSGILQHTFPVALAQCRVSLNQDMRALTTFDGIVPRYVQLYLQLQNDRLLHECSKDGTTVASINVDQLGGFGIPIAPYPEQLRIVSAVNSLLEEVDEVEAAMERARKRMSNYRASLLHAACTGLLTADWRNANPNPEEDGPALLRRILAERRAAWESARFDGRNRRNATASRAEKASYSVAVCADEVVRNALPPGWTWANLGQLFDVLIGATPSRDNISFWNGNVNWVSSGEVAFRRIKQTREQITELGLSKTSTQIHPPGTVLLAMIGEGKTRGQAAILDVAACNSQNSAAIRVSATSIPSEYVYYWLESIYQINRQASAGGNQPALNGAKVQAIQIPIAPLEELQQIVALLSNSDFNVFDADKTIAEALKDLRMSILYTAFSGRLVSQSPDDEPATALLTRLGAGTAASPKRRRSARAGARP